MLGQKGWLYLHALSIGYSTRMVGARHLFRHTLPTFLHRKFADGFPDLFVEDAINVRNRHVAFLASFHTPSVIFEQISVIYGLPRLFVASFTLVLPFFPTGTLERVGALKSFEGF